MRAEWLVNTFAQALERQVQCPVSEAAFTGCQPGSLLLERGDDGVQANTVTSRGNAP